VQSRPSSAIEFRGAHGREDPSFVSRRERRIRMFPGWGPIAAAVFVWLAYLWTREVYKRFDKDLEELANSNEPIAKAVIILYWLATVVIVIVVGTMVWRSVNVIIGLLR
jgi:hypothetical protein